MKMIFSCIHFPLFRFENHTTHNHNRCCSILFLVNNFLFVFFINSHAVILPHEDKLSELNEKWSQVAPKTFLLYNSNPDLSEKVRKFYFGTKQTTKDAPNEIKGNKPSTKRPQIGWDDLEGLTNAYSDRYFIGCVRDAAILHAKHAPTYLYYYTYKPEISYGYIQETVHGYVPVQLEIIFGYLKFRLYRDVLKWDINDYGKHDKNTSSLLYHKATMPYE